MKRHVSLEKILAARDHRQSIQAWMLRSLPNPLITFTLNIVGPIKVFPLSIKTFNAGVTLIKDTLAGHGYIITQEEIIQEQTGYEAFFSVSGSPLHLK
ncbi:MAG: citrate lyase holo-[acyl-carrier protein] synthase, partial [Eubacterium sp.]